MTQRYDEHPYSKFEDAEIERRLAAWLPGCLDFPESDDREDEPITFDRFPWQHGPRGEDGENENGLLPTDLIYLARRRLEFFNSPAYQDGRYRDRHNSLAITALEEAFHWCVARAFGRVRRSVSGVDRP